MTTAGAERKLLDVIEPFVLLSASTLITCAYRQNYSAFDLMSRPHVFHARANAGRVDFELPEWIPVEEALLGVADAGLHSMVKHLALQRAAGAGKPGMRIHRIQLGPELCREGDLISLTYSPWFRFAAPPYRFEVGSHAAAYVASALGRLARARGFSARCDVKTDRAALWLSESLRIEVLGADMLTDVAISLDGDEASLSFVNPQLSVARAMFPDVYTALRSASEAGEQFRGVSLLIEEDQVLLYGSGGAADVQA